MVLMFRLGFAVLFAMTAGPLVAQTTGVPAEWPPEGFAEDTYVDSRGCAFARARFNGTTTWAPRVTRDRQPICGREPSLFAAVPNVRRVTPVSAPRTASPADGQVATPAQREASSPPPPAPDVTRVRRAEAPARSHPAPRRRQGPARVAVSGFQPAFTDGRLNPHRGPRTAAGDAQTDRIWTREVPRQLIRTRPALVATRAPTGPQYVQVGTYRQAETVGRAVARLSQLGLPSRTVRSKRGLRKVTVVLAGPFGSADQTDRALSRTRSSGFPDAVPIQ